MTSKVGGSNNLQCPWVKNWCIKPHGHMLTFYFVSIALIYLRIDNIFQNITEKDFEISLQFWFEFTLIVCWANQWCNTTQNVIVSGTKHLPLIVSRSLYNSNCNWTILFVCIIFLQMLLQNYYQCWERLIINGNCFVLSMVIVNALMVIVRS